MDSKTVSFHRDFFSLFYYCISADILKVETCSFDDVFKFAEDSWFLLEPLLDYLYAMIASPYEFSLSAGGVRCLISIADMIEKNFAMTCESITPIEYSLQEFEVTVSVVLNLKNSLKLVVEKFDLSDSAIQASSASGSWE